MKFYAQLNENSICIGISQLSGEVIQDDMIEISTNDDSYMWKKYENGVWSDGTFEPIPEPIVYQPTNTEIYDNQMGIMAGLFDLYMKS